jgi:hypothetical protein
MPRASRRRFPETMRLIGHIIWKDVRQDWWALLCWLTLFLAQVALGFAFLRNAGSDLVQIDELLIAQRVLTVMQPIIGYLLALRWVQADELSGTRMFWLTRPISGPRLFAAKTIGLTLVFCALPLVLWVPWWLECGLGSREISWLAVETFGTQISLIAPALLIGSLTADFGRAIMWSLVLGIAMVGWSGISRSNLAVMDNKDLIRGVWFSRMFIGTVLLVIGSVGIAAYQFLKRNIFRSFVLGGGWALAIVLVGRFWSTDFSAAFDRPGDALPAEPVHAVGDKISLSMKKAKLTSQPYKRYTQKGPENIYSLLITFDIAGLTDGLFLGGEHPFQELQWSDGPAVRSANRSFSFLNQAEQVLRRQLSLPTPLSDPETVRWGQARLKKSNEVRAAKGLPPLEDHWPERLQAPEPPTLAIRFEVPESAVARIQAEPPAYITEMDAKVGRMEIIQTLPLTPGSRGKGSLRSLRVLSRDNWLAKLVETVPAYRRLGLFHSRIGERRPNPDRPQVRAINTVTGDINWVQGRNLVPTDIVVGGIEIKWTEATVRPDEFVRDDKWVPKDPEWPEHTQLVVLVWKEVGSFKRDIRIDHLAVQFPKTKAADSVQPGSGALTGDN